MVYCVKACEVELISFLIKSFPNLYQQTFYRTQDDHLAIYNDGTFTA
jgi:hypothetical protein